MSFHAILFFFYWYIDEYFFITSVNEAPIQKHEYLLDFTPDMLEK